MLLTSCHVLLGRWGYERQLIKRPIYSNSCRLLTVMKKYESRCLYVVETATNSNDNDVVDALDSLYFLEASSIWKIRVIFTLAKIFTTKKKWHFFCQLYNWDSSDITFSFSFTQCNFMCLIDVLYNFLKTCMHILFFCITSIRMIITVSYLESPFIRSVW